MKLLIIFLLIFLNGCSGDEKFISYICPNHSEDCQINKPTITSYKVNIKEQQVLVTVYLNNKPSGNIVWKNDICEIFDEKNWNCTLSQSGGVIFSYRMVQGELFHDSDSLSIEKNFIYVTKRMNFWNSYW